MSRQSSNLRPAPRGVSPLLVGRILAIFERLGGDDAPAEKPAPRLRLGIPCDTPPVVPIDRYAGLHSVGPALAFLRASGVSVSVAERSQLGTRWWVSGYPDAFDAAQIVELARAKGFAG